MLCVLEAAAAATASALMHISCAQVGATVDLCASIRPFSVVLMAEMAAAGQSPAAADVDDDGGWVYGWFWGDAAAVCHGFGG